MVYRTIWVCCAMLTIFSQAQAQDTLSLSRLWEQSFATYPGIKSKQAAINQADLNRRLTRNAYLPQLQLQAQNTLGSFQGLPGAFFPLPGIFNVSGGNLSSAGEATNLVGSAVINWDFLQFGRHKKAVEASAIQMQQSSAQLEQTKLRLQASVTRDYINLLFYGQMRQWATANTQRFQELLAITRSRTRSGLSPGADSLLVIATLRQARADIQHWQGEQEASQEALAKWTCYAPEAMQPATSRFFAKPRISLPDTFPPTHPALQVQDRQVAYAEKQHELSDRSVLPSVSLLAGALVRSHATLEGPAEQASWYDMYEQPAGNFLVGIGITWNLSRLYDQRLRSHYFQHQVNQQQETLNEIRLDLRERQSAASRQLQWQQQQITDAQAAYQSAWQAYQLFKARYRSGIIGLTELLQIQQVLQQTEKTRIHAYHQYWQYATELAAARADFSFLAQIFD